MLKLSVIQLSLLLGAQCHTASALLWTPVGLPPGRGSGRCPQARALTVMLFLIWEQGGVYKVSELLELHETFLCFFSPWITAVIMIVNGPGTLQRLRLLTLRLGLLVSIWAAIYFIVFFKFIHLR